MKRKITYRLFVFALLQFVFYNFAFAQGSLAPVLVGSTGNYSTAGFGSISSSVGEPVVTTVTTGTLTLTQGFQQSLLQISISSMGSSPNDSICLGKSATLFASITNNNIPTTTYNWSPAASLSCSTCPNPIATPTITTTYTLVVSDGINGSDSDTIKIYVLPNPTAIITLSTNDSICAGSPTTLTGNASGTTGPYSFVWAPGGTTTPAITVSPPVGNNTFTVIATDKFGCKGSATQTVTVISTPTITITGTTTVCSGNSTTLSASGANSYLWSPGGATTSSITTGALTSNTTYTVTGNNFMCADTKTVSVTVNPLPSANIVPALTTICSGQSTTFTASGGGTYLWNPGGQTDAAITVSPTVNTAYTVTVTDGNGCTRNVTSFATVNPTPTVSVSPANTTICSGSSATLTASGGISYLWNTGETTTTINPSPTTASTYTVTGTDANSCSTTATASVSVNTPPFVIITKTQTIFCEGDSSGLTASGGTTYLWNPGGQTTTAIWAKPSVTTTFTLTVSSGVCSVDSFIMLTVLPNPTITVSPNTSICNGQSATLTASGGNTYSWSTSETTTSIVVSPTTTATYTVTGWDANFCENTATVSVAVNAPPTASISGASSICAGETATLTAGGGTSYSWSTGATATFITVSPTAASSYTAFVTDANGCSDTATHVLNISPSPTISITYNSGLVVCQEDSITITASGGSIYYWPNLLDSNASVTFLSPVSGVKNYSVIVGTAAGCLDTAIATLTITPTPSIVISGNTTICTGETTTLLASGGTIYSWSTTETTSSISVAPTTTSGYTVFVTDGNGCNADSGITVSVNSPPIANINGQTNYSTTICSGSSLTLPELSGAGTYLWSDGSTTSSITVNPTTATSYSVVATNSFGCSDTAFASVSVNPTPTVAITASSATTFCQGDSVTLTATAAVAYLWSDGSTTQSITVSASGNYSVTITDVNGCAGDSPLETVVVNPLPSVVLSTNTTICLGQTVTLTASGGTNYSWWNGGQLTATITDSPPSTGNTNYTVTVTNAGGCSKDSSVTVTVNPAPTPTVTANDSTLCSGDNASLTASGGTSYSWFNTGQTSSSISINPTSSSFTYITYTVNVSNGSCSVDDTISIAVYPVPTPTVSASPSAVCPGDSATLSASGGVNYSWSTGATSSSIIVFPTGNTTYTVNVGNSFGCADTATISVTIINPPTASISGSTTICSGQTTTLTASGGGTYSWSNGSTASAISVSPTVNTGYIVTVSNGSCSDTASVMVNVTTSPTAAISLPDTTICGGTTLTITASGGGTYSWSTTATSPSISVTPSDTTVYTVIVSSGSCSDTASVTINVNTVTASVTGNTSLCIGDSTTLTAGGGGTYLWSTTETTSSIVINATATGSTNYTVTVTDAGGCTDDTVVTVVVNSLPVPVITSSDTDSSVCFGSSITLTASGGNTYLWSTGATTAVITPAILANTTFTLTASNGNCSAVTAHSVTVLSLPTITITASDPDLTICLGDSISLAAGGGVIYQWLNNGSINQTIVVSPNTSTTYTLVGGGSNGCYNFATALVSLSTISVNAGADVTICPGYTAQLNASVSGNTSTINYLWSPGNMMADAAVQNPSVNPDSTTAFSVEVTGDGCYAADTVVVVVDRDAVCDFCEKIYNGITPNGDGANDVWWIDGIQSFPKNTVSIFNRWGTKAWDASGYNNKDIIWKGTNQQGEPLPDGTYYYVIEVTSGDRTETCTGWVEVTH